MASEVEILDKATAIFSFDAVIVTFVVAAAFAVNTAAAKD